MESEITFIYTFRDRDLLRIKKSLDSLKNQKKQNFKVIFVDYGSALDLAEKVEKLVISYNFASYCYSHTYFQPWNKSRAINMALQKTETPFCFIADVDILYKDNFTEYISSILDFNKVVYFQAGFLSKEESLLDKNFEDYQYMYLSKEGGTGWTLFPKDKLFETGGFDEFYHFWGGEDTDAHVRMVNKGLKLIYDTNKLYLLHQYHDSFHRLMREKGEEINVPENIVEINHQNLLYHKIHKILKVNENVTKGYVITKNDITELHECIDKTYTINNSKQEVEYFLKNRINNSSKTVELIVHIKYSKNVVYYLKKVAKKKNKSFYSKKEVISLIYKEVIFNYRNSLYSIINNKKDNSIKLIIKQ